MNSWWDIFSSINLLLIFSPAAVAVISMIAIPATLVTAVILPVEAGWYDYRPSPWEKFARVLIWPLAVAVIWGAISTLIFVFQFETGAWVPLAR